MTLLRRQLGWPAIPSFTIFIATKVSISWDSFYMVIEVKDIVMHTLVCIPVSAFLGIFF
jgi:hypothetical protein